MTQPPYRPSEGNPMRRFALFSVALVILMIVGFQPSKGAASTKESICVCLPTRAALLLKSMKTNVAAITVKQATGKG